MDTANRLIIDMLHAIVETAKVATTMVVIGVAGHFTIDENTHLPMGWVLGGFSTAVVAAFWAGRNYSKIGQSLLVIETRLSRLEQKVEAQSNYCIERSAQYEEDQKHTSTCSNCGHANRVHHHHETGGATE